MKTKMISLQISMILTFVLALQSCIIQESIDKNKAFEKYLVSEDINSSIRITAPKSLNDGIKLNWPIGIHLENRTKHSIVLPWDFGIKIYLYEAGEWIEIENRFISRQTEDVIIRPQGPKNRGYINISVLPKLGGYNSPQVVRIMFVGTLIKNNQESDIPVLAFKEFKLSP